MSSGPDNPQAPISREFSLSPQVPEVVKPTRLNLRQGQPRVRPTATRTGDATSEVDISRYLNSIRRNWLLGAVLGLLLSGPLAGLIWWLCPDEYTAVEYVRIASNHAPLIFETVDTQGRFDVKSFKNTQRQLLIQPVALSKALKESGMLKNPIVAYEDDPVRWLQKKLKVTFPDEAEIMNISLTLTDATCAYEICRAVTATYFEEVVDKQKVERQQRVTRLEKVLAETSEKVRKMRNELITIVDATGTSDSATLTLAQQSTMRQFDFTRAELSKVAIEIRKWETELRVNGINPNELKDTAVNSKVKTGAPVEGRGSKSSDSKPSDSKPSDSKPSDSEPLDSEPPASTVSQSDSEENLQNENHQNEPDEDPTTNITDVVLLEQLENDRAIVDLTKKIAQKKNLIETTRLRYDRKLAEEKIQAHQEALEILTAQLRKRQARVLQLYERNAGKTSNPIEQVALRLSVLKQTREELQADLDRLETESKTFGRQSIDAEMKRKEIDSFDPVVERVTQEIERTKIEMESATRITVISSLAAPNAGENRLRIPLTSAGAVLGLLLPLGLLVLRDYRKNHVNNLNKINESLQLAVLGTIPRVPPRVMAILNDSTSKTALIWRNRLNESISAITALLLYKLESEGHRVIMVCSAMSGEGKSTLSEQLARGLASSGHRTLRIDFDLRRPTLNSRLKFELQPGTSDVLRNGLDLMQAVHETNSPNLSFLTAGDIPGSLLMESTNGVLAAFFDRCRTEFELIVIDSSPLLPVVDGRLVGQHADGVIMTMMKDRSQEPQVIAARKILADYSIPVLGCVFTGGTTEGTYGGYGGYGYGYGYGNSNGNSSKKLEVKQDPQVTETNPVNSKS